MNTDIWVSKYNPETIQNMVMNLDLKKTFIELTSRGTLNNICLVGVAGCGKTTLAKILAKTINAEVLIQSCSADGSIDMIKTKIQEFCQLYVEPGKLKIIILDEADQISQQGQMALRNIIVDSMEDTRFILTCNYLDKIINPIQSRCTPIKIEFTLEDVTKHILKILKAENIKFSKTDLAIFLKTVIKKNFPDIRSIIERLQLLSQGGELHCINGMNSTIENEVIQYITKNLSNINLIREYLLLNEEKFSSDYIKLAGELFNYYKDDSKKMLIIADYIYKMTLVFDKEIQFTAMLLAIQS